MKYFFDTEFHETDEGDCQLISLGMVCEDGRELYIEIEFDEHAVRSDPRPWVAQNVLPHLIHPPRDRLSREGARDAVAAFVRPTMAIPRPADGRPEFWGYFVSTDWTLLYRLWGRMVDLPPYMPHHPWCLQQWWRMLGSPDIRPSKPHAHNALLDARWTREFYSRLASHVAQRGSAR